MSAAYHGSIAGRRAAALVVAALLGSGLAWAGPPYATDDPEPVAPGHWELYQAFQWSWHPKGAIGTSPHFEVNYGALPGVQLHAIAPLVLAWSQGQRLQYGPGDVELGIKLRLVDASGWRPQVGIFPLLTLPTGAARQGLGAGALQAVLPIWLQQSWGAWTSYGGGGVQLAADGNAAFLGWLVQREFCDRIAIGGEAFVLVPLDGAAVQARFNLGAVVDLTPRHHLLLSVGPTLGAGLQGQTYVGYLLTL